jgi:hypothetical protein
MLGFNLFKYITESSIRLFKAEAVGISDWWSLCDYSLEVRVGSEVLVSRGDRHKLLKDFTRLGVFKYVCWQGMLLSSGSLKFFGYAPKRLHVSFYASYSYILNSKV